MNPEGDVDGATRLATLLLKRPNVALKSVVGGGVGGCVFVDVARVCEAEARRGD